MSVPLNRRDRNRDRKARTTRAILFLFVPRSRGIYMLVSLCNPACTRDIFTFDWPPFSLERSVWLPLNGFFSLRVTIPASGGYYLLIVHR